MEKTILRSLLLRSLIIWGVAIVPLVLFTAEIRGAVVCTSVNFSDFTSRKVVESFEGLHRPVELSASENLPTPFLFPSGARLTKPAPNHSDTSGVFVFDKTSGFGFTATDIAPYIPDGTAYLVEGSNPPFPLTFTFPEPQLMVGAFVTEPLTISAYNKNGALLGYESISAADVYKWKSSFLGIKVIGDGIASVTFSGNAKQINGLRLDMLTFETVPEPSTIALLLTACIGSLLWWRRR